MKIETTNSYPKMDPVKNAEWVQALRSGNFVQGEGQLKRKVNATITYCCLGVLCEVMGIPSQPSLVDHSHYLVGSGEDVSTDFLPNAAAKQCGISATTEPGSLQIFLSDLNDGDIGRAKHSFDEIADWIEHNL